MDHHRPSVDNLPLGVGIIARKSLVGSNRKTSQVSLLNDNFVEHYRQVDDRNWSWSYLRASFRRNQLGVLYDRYQRRLQNSYFNVFLLLQTIISLVYIGILLYVSIVNEDQNIEIKGCNATFNDTFKCTIQDNLELTVPEIGVNLITAFYCFCMFLAVYNEKLFRSSPNLQIVLSVVTTFIFLGVDIALSVFFYQNYRQMRTSSAFPLIIMVYFFLPVPYKRQAIILGAIISAVNLTASAMFYSADRDNTTTLLLVLGEGIYYLCGNVVGVYCRYLSEIAIRRAFMDRRGYIKSTIKRKYEKVQEEQLLLSILPEHISSKVKEELRNAIEQFEESQSQSSHHHHHRQSTVSPPHHHIHHKKPFSELFVERHNNVTILYADIVNFTPLTVKLSADVLVETLNELFGRFDDAATRNGCVRIKLLGDCYYCVAGLKEQSPDHAKNCVMLGFEMIQIIREIRTKLQVDLEMRIGIHSGNILSGLLGIYKWQFDIWSRDVTIAQHMEQSGKPGRIHITRQTKSFLGNDFPYPCRPAFGKRRDKYLHDNEIDTYFITPPRTPVLREELVAESEEIGQRSPRTKFNKGVSPLGRRGSQILGKAVDLKRRKSSRGDRRNNLSNPNPNDVLQYLNMLEKVNQEMEKAIDEMPLRGSDQYCPGRSRYKNSISNQVNPYTMSFSEMDSEVHFQMQPDPLFKFYIACSLFVLICIGSIQSLAVHFEHTVLWICFGGVFSCILLLIPFAWVGYIWSRIKDPQRDLDFIPEPENKIVRFFFNTSNRISSSCLRRTLLYLLTSTLISVFAIVDVYECGDECDTPWFFTFSCCMAILVNYAFFRIHYLLKLLVSLISMAGYFATIIHFRRNVFEQNNGVSPGLSAADWEILSHIFYITWITMLLHTMDRQLEYINRLDFVWKRKLTEGHKEASLTHAVNTILIHNILPTQIAKIYLDPNRVGEGYSRTYKNVSIMFASIPNFMDFYTESGDLNKQGLVGLNVLNQIITEFDQALFNHIDVEKIKVIGSTYMAACGLEVHETGRLSTTSLLDNDEANYLSSWREYGRYNSGKENPEKRKRTMLTLVQFAADMMMRLQMINREAFQDFKLRVGIATGLVVAGVVGSQKPLFDIWSDTVNMASRLDSHGQTGKIHVTEYGAELLTQDGVQCEPRGIIHIKGKGNMKTYFVCMNNQFEIQYMDLSDDEEDGHIPTQAHPQHIDL